MTYKLDHIAVAVRDVEEAVSRFEAKLGLPCTGVEDVPSEKARVAFFDLGGVHLELVQSTESGSAIDRSIERRGEGLHHICLEVTDLETVLRTLKEAGLPLINPEPVPGSRGTRVAFLHPKGLHGVLVELVEKPKG